MINKSSFVKSVNILSFTLSNNSKILSLKLFFLKSVAIVPKQRDSTTKNNADPSSRGQIPMYAPDSF